MKIRPHYYIAVLFTLFSCASSLPAQTRTSRQTIPQTTLLKIVKAEDERRWDGDLRTLLNDPSAIVRTRAALAAGRIGNTGAIAELSNMLANDKDLSVRSMAAFAIGEGESVNGAAARIRALSNE